MYDIWSLVKIEVLESMHCERFLLFVS